jgi:hypothetical protein
LSAFETYDPDGDELSYRWWQYYDVDNVNTRVEIINSTSQTDAYLVVPDESGKDIHIILEVSDNGIPSLTSYKRVILRIK